MKKLLKSKKGFTLMEVIIVLAVVAIIAAIAVPNIKGLITEAKITAEVAAATEITSAINIYNVLYDPDIGNQVTTKSLYDLDPTAATAAKLTETDIIKMLTEKKLNPELDDSLNPANVFKRISIVHSVAKVTQKGEISQVKVVGDDVPEINAK